MQIYLLSYLFLLAQLSSAQTSLPDGSASSGGPVTSISTLAIIIPPPNNTSSQGSGVPSVTSTTSSNNVTFTSSSLQLPTVAFTGQAILVGTCNVAQYTRLTLLGGGAIEVPLVGCSDGRPECCPSFSPPEPESTGASGGDSSTVGTRVTSLTATGVVSMLSASPLSICPHDFVDIDPVCCPKGYSLYGQAIVGGITPCYSILSTTMPLPASVSRSIVSAAAATASSTATISVIVNEVYALGLPCADDDGNSGQDQGGLSTADKVGIGIGAGLGGLLLLGLGFLLSICLGKGARSHQSKTSNQSQRQAEQFTSLPDAMTHVIGMRSPHTGQMYEQFHRSAGYFSSPPNQPYNRDISHSSWISQASGVPPQYQPPTVELPIAQSGEIHEMGEEDSEARAAMVDGNLIAKSQTQSFNTLPLQARHRETGEFFVQN